MFFTNNLQLKILTSSNSSILLFMFSFVAVVVIFIIIYYLLPGKCKSKIPKFIKSLVHEIPPFNK